MAGRSRRSWLSVLLGLVLGFLLASRLILPRASELKTGGHRRQASLEGCRAKLAGGLLHRDPPGGLLWPHEPASLHGHNPPAKNFLFVGVMTAQKYLQSRAVAVYRHGELFPYAKKFEVCMGEEGKVVRFLLCHHHHLRPAL
uniref:Chondroitin sulfate synthase 1 n=1 Tax=Sphaerodactylus townsendi TaxID=933632 RepID=A0ACB8E5K3_9SAUR